MSNNFIALSQSLQVVGRHAKTLAGLYYGKADSVDQGQLAALMQLGILTPNDHAPMGFKPVQEVNAFFRLLMRDHSRQITSPDVANAIRRIRGDVETYRMAQKSGSTNDRERAEDRLQDSVDSLSDQIEYTVRDFFRKINSEFAYFDTLDLRISENEKAIKEAAMLVDNLSAVSLSELDEIAGSDSLVSALINRLSRTLTQSTEEMNDAISRMHNLLFELKSKSRFARLLEAFSRRYDVDPDFSPGQDLLNEDLEALNIASGIKLHAQFDWSHDRGEGEQQVLNTLSQVLRGRSDREARRALRKVGDSGEFSVGRYDQVETAEPPVDEGNLAESIYRLFIAAIESPEGVRSTEFVPDDLADDIGLWLWLVLGQQEDANAHSLEYELIESKHTHFESVSQVHDIRVFQSLRAAA